ncbi:FAD-dependent monooxygenase [Amycolatopsis rhabdoformis]|uniref:FAD-dependent monooxygenase n=1 Tax=Amycolatopsis rhabdoformis TaxID=1448059 RepID=A0ABZ1ILP8_9PSEU|nr:FAD-dependent monooxygenase [Amycolatopsis rhabdoformis]WSE34713.1 FAD-dependent monooxygenase [Amycolatopsis rhabdoformis]
MKILVVGGGPAGLYFATLAARALPRAEVTVREQNPKGVTYGWGVALMRSALDALRPSAPDLVDELATNATWHDVVGVGVDSGLVEVRTGAAGMNPRWWVLSLLEQHALAAGVVIDHESRMDPEALAFGDWDLVVGADGVNSGLRTALAEHFAPTVEMGDNWLAWYGTPKLLPLSILLQNTDAGMWVAHAGQFSAEMSNFTVEIGQDVYDAQGFADLSDAESLSVCEEVFAGWLDGAPLIANHSAWFQTKFVTCRNWTHENIVLIGDALHTVHPSIGSGTRFAMRDAVYLIDALDEARWDVAAGLRGFEEQRRPSAEGFQKAARRSLKWYETLPGRRVADPVSFAIEYFMRTGRIKYATLRGENKELFHAYETFGGAVRS